MPETTPIYDFPYPCQGDAITVAAFADLANAIDTKLLELQEDEYEALNRYNQQALSASNVINTGVDTVIAGANSTYTIPADGVWQISALTESTATSAAPTSSRLRVRKNGVVQFGIRQNNETGRYDIQAVGCIVAAAGDVISFQFLFTGTGTWTLSVDWRAQMHVRIAN